MNFKLGEYRESRGLTQKELARLIGKSIGTIQSWEYGDSYPNAEMLWRLCEFFDTDPNTMLGWYDEHPRDEAPPLMPDEAEIVGCYRSSTPERKHSLMMTARDSAAMSKEAAERPSPGVREAV